MSVKYKYVVMVVRTVKTTIHTAICTLGSLGKVLFNLRYIFVASIALEKMCIKI
jgi:hypothetical protein